MNLFYERQTAPIDYVFDTITGCKGKTKFWWVIEWWIYYILLGKLSYRFWYHPCLYCLHQDLQD